VTTIEPWLREILRCPSCGGTLRDGADERLDAAAENAPELQCTSCRLAYRVDDGIPVLLVDQARTRE
jgi:uncharacterized protein YbaR (Trm112 family)